MDFQIGSSIHCLLYKMEIYWYFQLQKKFLSVYLLLLENITHRYTLLKDAYLFLSLILSISKKANKLIWYPIKTF